VSRRSAIADGPLASEKRTSVGTAYPSGVWSSAYSYSVPILGKETAAVALPGSASALAVAADGRTNVRRSMDAPSNRSSPRSGVASVVPFPSRERLYHSGCPLRPRTNPTNRRD
jgi:hypothetical protein